MPVYDRLFQPVLALRKLDGFDIETSTLRRNARSGWSVSLLLLRRDYGENEKSRTAMGCSPALASSLDALQLLSKTALAARLFFCRRTGMPEAALPCSSFVLGTTSPQMAAASIR